MSAPHECYLSPGPGGASKIAPGSKGSNSNHCPSKDKKENTLKALEFLKSENYPKDLGLFATGAIFMNPNSEILKAYLENARADYIKSPSIRDQVTINYSIWKSNKRNGIY